MHISYPIGSVYGIFTYIYHTNQPNVGKYRERATMGGWFLKENKHKTLRFTVFYAPEGSETLHPPTATRSVNIPYMDP